jgi:purine nucleosidase
MNRHLIIDADPGIDDAVAILLAIASAAELTVRAIVTVAGNAPVEQTASNARRVCELACRRDIPVYAGCSRPMRRPLLTGEDVHGESGLGDVELPESTTPSKEDGVEFLIRTLSASDDGAITLAALGPLTNVAATLTAAPGLTRKLREVVVMGGAFDEPGNITQWAEYNVYADPEAAAIVLESGVAVTMIPLDVTHTALTTTARMARLERLRTHCGIVAAQMLRYFERSAFARFGGEGAPLHDPCVIAYILRPQLFTGRNIEVAIDTTDAASAGRTVIRSPVTNVRGGSVQCLTAIDAKGYFDLLTDRLSQLP